jgi:cytochrome P450
MAARSAQVIAALGLKNAQGLCKKSNLERSFDGLPSSQARERRDVMTTADELDFFTDATLASDPYAYFERLRAQGPVVRLATRNVVAVTGYEEGLAVFRDEDRFSAAVAASGPLPPLPFTPEGDDISEQIERHRPEIPLADMMPMLDPPTHTHLKSLLMGIITPRRLKENEAAMWRLADSRIDTFIDRGGFEVIGEFALPYTGLVLGDLLGVPPEDFAKLPIERPTQPGEVGLGATGNPNNLFQSVEGYFVERIEQRRREPRHDVISDLAKVRYGDGTLPSPDDLAKILGFLFGAGQGTTTHLIGGALRFLAEDAELQARLRADPGLIPAFVEESLRLRGSTKTDFRLAKRAAKVGEVEVAPGTIVMLLIGAMNRDPRRFDAPGELRLDRPQIRDHIAFGRGIHACAGAPLARAETTVGLTRMLERTREIRIDEDRHGPPGARRFEHNPSYLMQGLKALHLKLTKA